MLSDLIKFRYKNLLTNEWDIVETPKYLIDPLNNNSSAIINLLFGRFPRDYVEKSNTPFNQLWWEVTFLIWLTKEQRGIYGDFTASHANYCLNLDKKEERIKLV